MSAMSNRLVLAALACLIAAPTSAQLIQRKDLSYAMAKTIAENALADCKARGYAVQAPTGGLCDSNHWDGSWDERRVGEEFSWPRRPR